MTNPATAVAVAMAAEGSLGPPPTVTLVGSTHFEQLVRGSAAVLRHASPAVMLPPLMFVPTVCLGML